MKMIVSMVIRVILTIALLVIVWMNSHWSVALAITGLVIANELQAQKK